MTRNARNSHVPSSPIWNGVASNTLTASTGRASMDSWVPNWLSESARNSWRKSWWRSRPPRSLVVGSGSAGGVPVSALEAAGGSTVMPASSPTDWELSIGSGKAAIVSGMDSAVARDEPSLEAAPHGPLPVGSTRQVWARREADEAEAKALASTLRLRILRATLHEPRTNKEI